MKNILILFGDMFARGGIQVYNRYFYQALSKEYPGYRFVVMSLNDHTLGQSRAPENVEIRIFGGVRLKLIRKLIFSLKAFFNVLTNKPILLICGHVDISPLALMLNKLFSVKYTVVTYGVEVWNLKRGNRYGGLKSADLILTISRFSKDKMIENGVPSSKIKLLPCAVDTTVFFRKEKDKRLLTNLNLVDKVILLSVGRISSREKYKGHDVMLNVLKILEENYVWIVIGDGDDFPRLKEKAKIFGVEKRAIFLENISDDKLIDYYNLCDIFILPSRGEGFGIVFLEAMACGKPVIGGKIDGSVEPLLNGKLGFLVDPDCPEEIAKTIRLVHRAKEARTNGEYLAREADNNFGLAKFNKMVKNIFDEILT